ncbi:MAG: hypothetical protein IPQ09_26190 [Myxococcales bacterium]|nr:hypothetical protein [Myxococcales bacterium]
MISPFAFIKSSAAAASHDPATDNLSLWLRSDTLSGTGATFAWSSKASAGTSGAAATFNHSTGYGDLVEQPSTSLDGHASALWTGASPMIESADLTRSLLGAGDSVGASYTAAYVVQPLASNTYGLTGGGKTDGTNPTIFGSPTSVVVHAIMSDAGTCKVGVHHYDEDLASGDGTTPVVWPGGFGAWGLMWVVYTNGGNAKVRVQEADLANELIPAAKGPAAYDYVAYFGTLGGGAYVPSFRLVEMMIYPGQALSGAQMITREQGYFKTRYPSLGL